jgi:signal transduction histidine kinase
VIVNSLRFRLLGAAVIVVFIVLQIAGAALMVLFERNVVRRIDLELDAVLEQLATLVTRNESGKLFLSSELADPRFHQPFAGHYWQISGEQGPLLRSRSLWDEALTVAAPPRPEAGIERLSLGGPDKQVIYAAVRSILLEPDLPPQADQELPAETRLLLIAGINETEIQGLKRKFQGDVVKALAVLALLLILASWAQVSVGLRPLEVLRTGLEKIRLGEAKRLGGDLPAELQPLVRETNRLLEAQEIAIGEARKRAGDLAHGLKTPLTALTILAQNMRESGQAEVARDIEQQLKGLGRHVERELARARIAAGAGISRRTPVLPVLSGLKRTLQHLPNGENIRWTIDCEPGLTVSAEEADLAETLGNLLDNARKWAREEVNIAVRAVDGVVAITVEDDGPGIAENDRLRVVARGMRLDEQMPGSGLGLTITKEMIEAYGGAIALGTSPTGGLSVRLDFPRPPTS